MQEKKVSEKLNQHHDLKSEQAINLALAASQRPENIGTCLSIEKMNMLVDKRLSQKQYNDAIEHLDTCQSCFDQWVEKSLEKLHKAPEPDPAYGILMIILLWIIRNRYRVVTFGCTIVIICSLLWFNQTTHIPEFQKMLNNSYAIVSVSELSVDELILNVLIDQDNSGKVYGMSELEINQSHIQAFKAGIITGRQMVLNNNDKKLNQNKWSKHPLNIYFGLGQWCFMTRAACISDSIPVEFWVKQKQILIQLKDNYLSIIDKNNDEYTLAYQKLEDIAPLIGKKSLSKDQKEHIFKLLTQVIEFLMTGI